MQGRDVVSAERSPVARRLIPASPREFKDHHHHQGQQRRLEVFRDYFDDDDSEIDEDDEYSYVFTVTFFTSTIFILFFSIHVP